MWHTTTLTVGKLVVEHMGTLDLTRSVVQLRPSLPNIPHYEGTQLLLQSQISFLFSLYLGTDILEVLVTSGETAELNWWEMNFGTRQLGFKY